MNTYNEVEANLPKVVLISSGLARLPEFEVMRALFSALDVRWLVVTDRDQGADLHRTVSPGNPMGSELFAVPATASPEMIADQLRSLTSAGPARPVPVAAKPSPPPPAPVKAIPDADRIIVIGSSTGGVDALISVLSNFQPDCPPTLIVQHTGLGFGDSLAGLLNRQCAARVTLASGTHELRRGEILIGAGIRAHLVLDKTNPRRATMEQGPPVSGHLPSVDVLFRSAVPFAKKVSAAILTGMGRDGAEGLKELRDAGARTIAQNQATSVVYGMPRAAVELGAAEVSLPLNRIGPSLLAPSKSRHEAHH
ncbi:CheB methylesterase domain-containing protein [Tropicibacter oceani]|uniref:protein-glutamate methylesterase n=1 Tax=Tropicibacter oceani TaxID=3058420 RepID=A0ABY8QGU4_9RHOB|nr:CheB methylesterase domain-containing protein [Tropicibacter oceani]WGW03744.1 CheB methylesterase domain-containing protein [Tropicibacter oceani]